MKDRQARRQRYRNVLPVMAYFYRMAWQNDKSYFVLVFCNMLVRGGSPFLNIVLPKFLIDELVGARRPEQVLLLVAVLVLSNYLLSHIRNLLDYFLSRSQGRLSMKLDELLGDQIMRMDFEYTENAAVLDHLEKARTGMSWYSGGIGGFSESLTNIAAGAITLAGTLAIICSLSPWLILLLLLLIAGNLFLTSLQQKQEVQFRKDLVGINRRFNYYFDIVKSIRYGKDIRMYHARPLVLGRVSEYIDKDWVMENQLNRSQNKYNALLTGVNVLQQTLLYGVLGLRVLGGVLGIGDFQMLISAANSFTDSLGGILRQIIAIGTKADFMNEYRTFMEYPAAQPQGTLPVDADVPHTFEFQDVSFRYPEADSDSLSHVSLTIPAGQTLSVVGENGAGKTTFIKLLCRLYDVTDGRILMDGVDIREYDREQYRRLFSVVFQDYRLFSFTIAENVSADDRPDRGRVLEALKKAGFQERLEQLEKGIDTPVYKNFEKDGVEFSGGESQKLAIARAMYRSSPIAILDEPTAALDPLAEADIYQRFDALIGGKTALYISHRLSSSRFCDRIAVFHQGALIEYGSHHELAGAGGKYSEMWQAQAQYYL
ncbi:MAG: ABC transporter ATP-binding protein [Clostridiales bacterium]|nr:ABC transporter ATP-binding protein [Clostridiales bacterium]